MTRSMSPALGAGTAHPNCSFHAKIPFAAIGGVQTICILSDHSIQTSKKIGIPPQANYARLWLLILRSNF